MDGESTSHQYILQVSVTSLSYQGFFINDLLFILVTAEDIIVTKQDFGSSKVILVESGNPFSYNSGGV